MTERNQTIPPDRPLHGFKAWLARAAVLGSATSIILHISLVALAAVITVGLVSTRHDRSISDGDLIIALSPETELTDVGTGLIDASAPPVVSADHQLELPDISTAGILDGPGGDDAPGSGPGFGPIGEGLGGAGGGDVGEGSGIGSGGAGGGASFFGVEASGNRFAYIIDVSGSMDGEKLQALQIELAESVNGLLDHMSFLIMLYASDAFPLGDHEKWTVATPAGRRWALAEIQKLQATGGTEPWPAFDRIFAQKPSPDAIYFMTDGEFDAGVVGLIAMRNKGSKKIPIHCITFVNKAAEEVMRKIASDSGGTYSHIEGPR